MGAVTDEDKLERDEAEDAVRPTTLLNASTGRDT